MQQWSVAAGALKTPGHALFVPRSDASPITPLRTTQAPMTTTSVAKGVSAGVETVHGWAGQPLDVPSGSSSGGFIDHITDAASVHPGHLPAARLRQGVLLCMTL